MLEQSLERESSAERGEDGPILPGKGGAGWPLALQDVMVHHPSDPGDDFRLASGWNTTKEWHFNWIFKVLGRASAPGLVGS